MWKAITCDGNQNEWEGNGKFGRHIDMNYVTDYLQNRNQKEWKGMLKSKETWIMWKDYSYLAYRYELCELWCNVIYKRHITMNYVKTTIFNGNQKEWKGMFYIQGDIWVWITWNVMQGELMEAYRYELFALWFNEIYKRQITMNYVKDYYL